MAFKHPFNSLFSMITLVSWYQKGKPFWILMKQQMMGWQGHWVNHANDLHLLQKDNHVSDLVWIIQKNNKSS